MPSPTALRLQRRRAAAYADGITCVRCCIRARKPGKKRCGKCLLFARLSTARARLRRDRQYAAEKLEAALAAELLQPHISEAARKRARKVEAEVEKGLAWIVEVRGSIDT